MVKLTTFSIAAHCSDTGQVGIAVSTAIPGVGMLCPFVRSSVGAVATQSFVNPYLGLWGLDLLAQGKSAQDTLAALIKLDAGIAQRQLGLVDRHGGSAAFSGSACDGWYGDLTGPHYAIAGNMLLGAETLEAMQRSFLGSGGSPLVERLILALEAGQAAGGDKRGKVSAAVKVYATEDYPWLDLRVDEHSAPVAELRRVYEVVKVKLVPLLGMMPTKAQPSGTFDMQAARESGVLQDR